MKIVRTHKYQPVHMNGMVSDLEALAWETVVTEIDPSQVQSFSACFDDPHPFRCEVTLVTLGKVFVVESDELGVNDRFQLFEQGLLVAVGDMVIVDPGVRYTFANLYENGQVKLVTYLIDIPLIERWLEDRES